MSLNLAFVLRESAATFPDKPALLFDGGQMTYAELDALSDQVARGLRARGLAPGDRIGLQLPNLPQFVVAYFAILKAGCVAVPMNVLLKAREVAFQLENCQAQALIAWSGVLAEAAAAAEQARVGHLYVVSTPGIPEPTVGIPFAALLTSPADEPAPFEATDPGATAVLIYTSGTTGQPKGAELSHFQLLMNADTPGRLFGMRDDDVVVVVLPLFHIFGLASQLNVAIRFGATLSLVTRFDTAKVVDVIRRDKVSVFVGVPTMFLALLSHPDLDPAEVSSLRIGVSGGAAIPAEVLDGFQERFGIVVLEGYGLTETASTTTFNTPDAHKPYSTGRPIWGVEVEVWDGQDRPLPPGSANIGEIVVRGLNVMRGYFGNPEATEQAFTRGWLRTGDLGYLDDEGFLFIVDRTKDLIIRGGYNVYPREVEEVLYTHPGIAEAAVVGVADARLGEEVRAVVTARPGASLDADDVIAFAKERMAAYKYPRIVEIVDELPHGPTGKILKKLLR